MQNLRTALIVFLLATVATTVVARLDETKADCDKRYGIPRERDPSIEYPLIEGADNLVYTQEGWKIYVAFVGGKAARIEYSKIRGEHPSGTVVIMPADIETLLDVESADGAWTEAQAKPASNPFAAFDRLVDNTRSWTHSGGWTATLKNNKTVMRFETPAAKTFEEKGKNAPASGL